MAAPDIDFMAIGKHCTVEGCHQLDFLPLTCRKCRITTCSEHGPSERHNCRSLQDDDVCFLLLFCFPLTYPILQRRVVTCPICNQMIRTPDAGVSLNDQVELHITSGCKANVSSPKVCDRLASISSLHGIIAGQEKVWCQGLQSTRCHHNQVFKMCV